MSTISAIHSQAVFHRHSVPQTQPNDQSGANKQVTNPAQSAKAALIDRPDLSSKPLGSLVSLFAKGLPLPPFENAGDTEPSSDQESIGTPSDASLPVI